MNKEQISKTLRDYAWMMNSIMMIESDLNQHDSKVTALYGLEAAMPKAKGDPSDPVSKEVCRREKKWNRLERYKNRCGFITDRMHRITDDRELEVLHLILDGFSNRKIARHMGFSHTHIKRIQDSIVDKLDDDGRIAV
ncbi:LuxR C-terminal-related transcriptional regulator [Jeotgalibacillus malaysiensis]|uniref:LuxR C-terminal-related transcriptional regulator n=1 Tax=Jeotgalibacillus malaysiensis TaxID=1508404 RepID=UPI00384F9B86